jgi:hypothetical protein
MDDAEARAILRAHEEEPPVRGKLGPDWIARATHYADQDSGTPAADSYDGGTSEADFSGTTEAAEPPAAVAERKPRRVQRKPKPTLRERFTKAQAKPKKRQPRVSVAPLIGNVWGFLGSMAGRVDRPLGNCLMLQSDVAGDILEDVVKGTFMDPILQPIARARDKGKAVTALVLPPAVVVAIERAQMLPEDQMKARMAFLEPILVQSLMMWGEVAGGKLAAMAERIEQEGPAREQAERMARLIFAAAGPAPAPKEAETVGV